MGGDGSRDILDQHKFKACSDFVSLLHAAKALVSDLPLTSLTVEESRLLHQTKSGGMNRSNEKTRYNNLPLIWWWSCVSCAVLLSLWFQEQTESYDGNITDISAALSNMFQSFNMQLFPCMTPAVQGIWCKKGVASEVLTYIKRGVFFNTSMILEHHV